MIVLDAGALIAADRGDKSLRRVLDEISENGGGSDTKKMLVPVCVLAQTWRDGARQARLARFLADCKVVGVPPNAGRRVGVLLAAAGLADVVDGSVVDAAVRAGATVIVTSDKDDLERLIDAGRLAVRLVRI